MQICVLILFVCFRTCFQTIVRNAHAITDECPFSVETVRPHVKQMCDFVHFIVDNTKNSIPHRTEDTHSCTSDAGEEEVRISVFYFEIAALI
ncbi:hypothetical protein Tsp_12824 [Trichinella spiralis]|uniref:hypothetical protein n=1 Tax=Trichinella spiralis TaxID=6334 RepID=UPI0001EFD227|nr:hypothetical protein Tsp_12824 [Trichinella spiralis]